LIKKYIIPITYILYLPSLSSILIVVVLLIVVTGIVLLTTSRSSANSWLISLIVSGIIGIGTVLKSTDNVLGCSTIYVGVLSKSLPAEK